MAKHDGRKEAGSIPDLASCPSEAGHPALTDLRLVPGSQLDALARAEASLFDHLVVTPGGLCVGCSEPEPCRARYSALDVFNKYGALPRRRPGIAGVYMAGGTGSFDAFAAAHTRSNEAM